MCAHIRKPRRLDLTITLCLAGSLASCVGDNPAAPRLPGTGNPAGSFSVLPIDSIDEPQQALNIARAIPTFAGMYFDDQGDLVIALTNTDDFARAAAAVRPGLGSHQTAKGVVRRATAGLKARKAHYTFLALASYKMALRREALSTDGVVMLDVDESDNRLTVGISNQRAETAVLAAVDRLGIPRESIHLIPMPAPQDAILTLESVQPDSQIQGGWRIMRSVGGNCTLGFPARRGSDGLPVFITNSHCTLYPHAADGVSFQQPTDGHLIGYEIYDPPTWTCGGDQCRNSDAAMIQATVPIQLGYIGKPIVSSGCEDCVVSTEIDPSDPVIRITSERTYVIENETLHKIGATSGWTYGVVEDRCADYNYNGWKKLCSDRVDTVIKEGDSGSPVFTLKWDGTAELVGILFGYVGFIYNDALMSNLNRIQMDLGLLAVAEMTVAIDGPTVVPPNRTCHYAAQVEGGRGPATYQWQKDWPTIGTDATVYVQTGTDSFNLTLTVTDADAFVAGDSKYIQVDPFALLPSQCY